jgi:hypothetical protein
MNIHGAKSITFQRVEFSNFYTHRFTVTLDDGIVMEFDAFAPVAMDLQMLPDDKAIEVKQAEAKQSADEPIAA